MSGIRPLSRLHLRTRLCLSATLGIFLFSALGCAPRMSRQGSGGTAAVAAALPQASAAYDSGLRLKRAKDHSGALSAFLRATKLDPKHQKAWTEAGNSQLALGQTKAASESFAQALNLSPNDQPARYNLAYTLRKQGRFGEAAEQYKLYLKRSPSDADAHYGLAESLKASGANHAAADAFDAYAKAEKRAAWKQWIAKANVEATRLRKLPKTSPGAPTQPAIAAAAPAVDPMKKSDPKTAKTPGKADLHLSFSAAGKPAASKPAVATPLAPRRPEAFEAGLKQLKSGNYADALVRLNVARSEAPKDSMVLAAIAGAHLGQSEGDLAQRAYEQALASASDPAKPALYLGLGESLRIQGNDESASEAYNRAVQHESASAEIVRICKARLAQR